MDEREFNALFGVTGKDGRKPTVCAVTGKRLGKTDNITRQRLPEGKFYVLSTIPLSQDRLNELIKLAKAGVKAAAPVKEAKNGQ